MASKRVQELSTALFFGILVKVSAHPPPPTPGAPKGPEDPRLEHCPLQESGPLESEAMVMGVLNQAFDVLVLRFGVQKRVYCNVSTTGVPPAQPCSPTVPCLWERWAAELCHVRAEL